MNKKVHYIELIEKIFSRYPARKKLIFCLLRHGLRIGEDGKILCGDIEISDVKIARYLEIDRRIVKNTIKFVLSNPSLKNLLTKIKPIARLDELGSALGLGVIKVFVKNARTTGVIYKVTKIVDEHKVSIRQLIAEDPELGYEPSLIFVLEKELPDGLVSKIKKLDFVTRIEIL
jgi:predicted regulator of amino acid metabolism with ACT domain